VLVWVALLAAALATFSTGSPEAWRDTKPNVCALETKERVVSIGDVHGAFDRFLAILKEAGLIDKDKHWSGGKAIFVQTGDILDRGPDSKKGLDFLKKLEDEANKAGGRVVSLLGNHEVMRMINDRRYVSDTEYQQFRSVDSLELRDNYYEKYLANKMNQLARAGEKIDQNAIRKKFQEETPLGSVELQQAFSPLGEYGQWLRTKDSIAIVNGVAYMHGGLSAQFAPVGCAQLNSTIRDQLKTGPPARASEEDIDKLAFMSPNGPLWYRGLVKSAEGKEKPDISDAEFDAILKAFGVRAMVVGHTPTSDAKVHMLFAGRLFQIDTGMLDGYGKTAERPGGWYPGGLPSAIEMLGGTVTAIYEGGKREVLVEGPTSVVR
jgi:hypothetical protein